MLTSINPKGQIEAYTDIGQFIGILPPDYPGLNISQSANDGGPGSGNFGHGGRPGKIGGSGKGGGKSFRSESSGSVSGYIGVQKTKAFRGIAKVARASDSPGKFLESLSYEQTGLIKKQHQESGSKESFEDYAERLQRMLTAQKPSKAPEYSRVDGKDLLDSYAAWDNKPYTEPRFGQVVDTDIERAIVEQGFNGPPKVVSQEEFDSVLKENPEMPLLMRSYTAPDAETLQMYDDQLDAGEWYVDCGAGGAAYGRGMYCAGTIGSANLDDAKKSAENEMHHYRESGEKVMRNSLKAVPPEGKSRCQTWMGSDEHRDDYFDPAQLATFADKRPEDGQLIAVKRYENSTPDTWIFISGRVRSIDGQTIYSDESVFSKWSWAPVEGTCKKEEPKGFSPQSSTRLMTLDPSAKIISSDELGKKREELKRAGKKVPSDSGTLAALLGYDAINAPNKEMACSYTVILNRTKVILSEQRMKL